MGKLIVAVLLVAAIAFAWHKGWIAEWFDAALDGSIDSVKRTQRDATRQRAADPGAAEEKK